MDFDAWLLGQEPGSARQRNLPLGVRDHLWQEARLRQDLEARVRTAFHAWGYNDVILPMFEFADTLDAAISTSSTLRLYRFLDQEGQPLVLRPDMTAAVARLVGTRLPATQGPYRFCYAGSVFRHEESSGLQYQQEFRQLGIELIGSADAQADVEVLACLSTTLHELQLHEFKTVLGHSAYVNGLLDALEPAPDTAEQLRWALHHKSEHALAHILDRGPITGDLRRALEAVLGLYGTDPLAVLTQAAPYCVNQRMVSALDNLQAICEGLQAYDELKHVMIDLAEIRDLDYYTGMTFEILLPDSAMVAGKGGRYDNLVGRFGPAQPAVGGTMLLDRLVSPFVTDQGPHPLTPIAPTVLVQYTRDPVCLRWIKQVRQTGIDVVVDTSERSQDQFIRYGQELQACFIVQWCAAAGVLHVLQAPSHLPQADLTLTALEDLLRQAT